MTDVNNCVKDRRPIVYPLDRRWQNSLTKSIVLSINTFVGDGCDLSYDKKTFKSQFIAKYQEQYNDFLFVAV